MKCEDFKKRKFSLGIERMTRNMEGKKRKEKERSEWKKDKEEERERKRNKFIFGP